MPYAIMFAAVGAIAVSRAFRRPSLSLLEELGSYGDDFFSDDDD